MMSHGDTIAAMSRPLSSLFSALSLFLCGTVLVLWARSYRGCDVPLRQKRPADRFLVSSEFGALVFEVEWPQRAKIDPAWSYFDNPLPRQFGQHRGAMGFAAYRSASRHYILLPPVILWGVTLPHWFAFIATTILPACWLARRRRVIERWRSTHGRCSSCGYDLTGNVSGICPECGVRASAVVP